MALNLVPLTRNRAVVNDGAVLTQEARFYFSQLELCIAELTALVPVSGTGSPEGSVAAIAGSTYYDLLAGTGAIIYIKTVDDVAGDTTQGWVLA